MKGERQRHSARVLLLVTLFAFLYVPFVWQHGMERAGAHQVDFPTFYAAALTAFSADSSPYGEGALDEAGRQLGFKVFPFLYPPPSLLLFYPLKGLPYENGRDLMLVLNHACFLFLLWFLPTRLYRLTDTENTFCLAIVLVYLLKYEPVVITLQHGQMNLILLCFLAGFWFLARRGATSVLPALLLSLAILLKAYAAILLLFLLLRRRYACALYTILFLFCVSLLSLAVLPRGTWGDWVLRVLPTGGYGESPLGLFAPGAPWNQSINGLTSRVFLDSKWSTALLYSPAAARIVPYVVSLGVLSTTLLAARRSRGSQQGSAIDGELTAFLLVSYLIAPLSWEHHLVYVIPCVLAIGWSLFREESSFRWPLRAGAVASSVVIAWPSEPVLPAKFFAVFILWLVSVWLMRKGATEGAVA